MNYEKAYKEALERAREFQKSKDGLCVLTAESIFPELRESEGERIRKWLIKYFNKADFNGMLEYVNGIKSEEIVSWLEKQGEQKPSWSDEDEENLQHCCGAVFAADYYTYEDKQDMEKWLLQLKERLS